MIDTDPKQDLGVPIGLDSELVSRIVSSGNANQVLVLIGYDLSGKTYALRRSFRQLKESVGAKVEEEYKYFSLKHILRNKQAYEEAKEALGGFAQGKYIIEATPGAISYVLTHDFDERWKTPAGLKALLKEATIGLKERIVALSTKKRSTLISLSRERGETAKPEWSKMIDEDIIPLLKCEVIGHKLSEPDKQVLLAHFSGGQLGNKEGGPLLQLASVEDGQLVVPLLAEVIKEHRGVDEKLLQDRAEFEKYAYEALSAFFGLGLFSGTISREAAEAIPTLMDLTGSGSGFLAIFGIGYLPFAAAGAIMLGLSAIYAFWQEKRDNGLRKYAEAHFLWNELPYYKRLVLCAKFDAKFDQPSLSSYDFLSNWLGKKENITPDKIGSLYTSFLNLQSQLTELISKNKSMGESILAVRAQLERCERRLSVMESWKTMTDDWKQTVEEHDRLQDILLTNLTRELEGKGQHVVVFDRKVTSKAVDLQLFTPHGSVAVSVVEGSNLQIGAMIRGVTTSLDSTSMLDTDDVLPDVERIVVKPRLFVKEDPGSVQSIQFRVDIVATIPKGTVVSGLAIAAPHIYGGSCNSKVHKIAVRGLNGRTLNVQNSEGSVFVEDSTFARAVVSTCHGDLEVTIPKVVYGRYQLSNLMGHVFCEVTSKEPTHLNAFVERRYIEFRSGSTSKRYEKPHCNVRIAARSSDYVSNNRGLRLELGAEHGNVTVCTANHLIVSKKVFEFDRNLYAARPRPRRGLPTGTRARSALTESVISDLVSVFGYQFNDSDIEDIFCEDNRTSFMRNAGESQSSYIRRQLESLSSNPAKRSGLKEVVKLSLNKLEGPSRRRQRERIETALRSLSVD